MSRILRFNTAESEGTLYLIVEGTPPEQVDALGEVVVPDGAKVFVILTDKADPSLGFLSDVEGDVVIGLRASDVDVAGVLRLATQSALTQLAISSALADDVVGLLAKVSSLTTVDLTLAGDAGAGVASLAGVPLQFLSLHGDPGSALAAIGSMTGLERLHFHADELTVAHLEPLRDCKALAHLDIEVATASAASAPGVVDALTELANGLESIAVKTDDGESAIPMPSQIALLAKNPTLTLNGATYTPAAVARLQRNVPVA